MKCLKILALALPMMMSACVNHVVTVRACVMDGARNPTASAVPAGVAAEAIVGASKIWLPHGIGLVPLPDPPILADPQTTTGKTGDLNGEGTYGNPEIDSAVQSCKAAWIARGYNTEPQKGLMVIFAREVINSPDIGLTAPVGSHCTSPYNIAASDVAGRWSIVGTVSGTTVYSIETIAQITAHELGHQLLLRDGDGRDNDSDGAWDLGCDDERDQERTELQVGDPVPLMWPYAANPTATLITPQQEELAVASVKALEQAGLAN